MPRIAVMFLLCCAMTGCITAKKYKLADKEGMLPPPVLNWSSSQAPADLTLQTVIVFKGPGSWKREARWDEYVVTISNQGAQPLIIEGAVLVDLLDQPQIPAEDPWRLEKLSYTNWDKYGKTGLKLFAGAGAVTLYGAAVVGTTYGSLLSGGAAASGGVAILNIIPVVAIVDITAVAVMNNQNRKRIEAEFTRRRLPLPLTVKSAQSVTGSYFFPMTPGPKKLLVRGRRGPEQVELEVDLKPLAALHLKPAGK